MNYFMLFGLPKKFKINKKLLSKNFYKLQLKFHPDLFINHSELKKKMILKKSIDINEGYQTLKNSLNRAIYLLFLDGFDIKKETFLSKNTNFLIKYFSLYEEIDFLKKNTFDEVKYIALMNKIKNKIKKYEKLIELEFDNKNHIEIIKIIEKLLFFKKIKANLKKE